MDLLSVPTEILGIILFIVALAAIGTLVAMVAASRHRKDDAAFSNTADQFASQERDEET